MQFCTFTIDGDKLKRVENFKCLGRQLCFTNSDTPILFLNLAKAWSLQRISCLITREAADPFVGGKFMLQRYFLCCCLVIKLGSGLVVCSKPYEDFIIVQSGDLLNTTVKIGIFS